MIEFLLADTKPPGAARRYPAKVKAAKALAAVCSSFLSSSPGFSLIAAVLRRLASVVLAAAALAGGMAQAAPPQEKLPDSMATRVLACTACHGVEGRATQAGYFPRIAGKPEGYLYNQLLNFRDGRRTYPQMSNLLEYLSDDYLREIAHHFANLQVPYAAPPPPQAPPSVLEHGRTLVMSGDTSRGLPACVQCHGANMMGVAPAIPGLLGLPRDYLNSQLGAWITLKRHAQAPDCMAQVAQKLTPTDVSALTAWLSAQPVPAGAKPAVRLTEPLPLTCGGVPEAAASQPATAVSAPSRR